MTPGLFVAQVAAAAVCGIALGKLLVELAAGGVAMVARRFGSRGEVGRWLRLIRWGGLARPAISRSTSGRSEP